ncbi:PKD domain-containing protein [Methanoplanus endosymbiosus]|uniref:PKD domain-containing protein n=1 Tax=Methanoplanus endosymbiosus TaxID=33865 RepID=A0A9E7PK27_9EURY|nr:PKD domain-containing protein [Methanoplanus endosymbiosus]UUX91368.1 PKD domain-containing protein [Methanoplanus endosymbiosus]
MGVKAVLLMVMFICGLFLSVSAFPSDNDTVFIQENGSEMSGANATATFNVPAALPVPAVNTGLLDSADDVIDDSCPESSRFTPVIHPSLWNVSYIEGNYSSILDIPEIGDGDTIRIWGVKNYSYEGGIIISAPDVTIEQWRGSPFRPVITNSSDILGSEASAVTVTADNLTLNSLNFSNTGLLSGGDGAGVNASGNREKPLEKLTVTNCIFTSNSVNRSRENRRCGGAISAVYVSGFLAEGTEFRSNSGYYGTVYLRGGSFVFSGNTVFGNLVKYGGGIYAESCRLAVDDTIMLSNDAGESGGGVYAELSVLTMKNTTVGLGIIGESGGGVYANGSTLFIVNSTLEANCVGESGSGLCAENSIVRIENSIVNYNLCDESGCGVCSYGGEITITDCAVNNNSGSKRGGGVYAETGTLRIENSSVENNTAAISGGGVFAERSPLTLVNNLFCNDENFCASAADSDYIWNALFNRTFLPAGNIAGGPYLGGNVWANPAGTGFSDTCPDMNYDGICDENLFFKDDMNVTVGTDELALVYNCSRGTLRVSSVPAGALLYVDGVSISRSTDSPVLLYLPAGECTIGAVKDGMVNLTAVSVTSGEKSSLVLTLESPVLVPLIKADPVRGTAPLSVAFSGSAAGNVVADTWNWTFGDGESAYSRNATHIFSRAGTWPVLLNASTSATGFSNETSRKIEVLLPSPVIGSPLSPAADQSVRFAGRVYGLPQLLVLDFGDGTSSYILNTPGIMGYNTSHSYACKGTYAVNLTVKAAGVSANSSRVNVTVVDQIPDVRAVNMTYFRIPGAYVVQTGDGKQKISVNISGVVSSGGAVMAVNNTIIVTKSDGSVIEISTESAEESGGDISGNVTKVLVLPKPVSGFICDRAGTAEVGLAVMVSGYEEEAALETDIAAGVADDAKAAFTAACPEIGEFAYTVYFFKSGFSRKSVIEGVTMNFSVKTSWVAEVGGSNSVRILRWRDGGASAVITPVFIGYSGENSVFQVTTDGFSVYAVASVPAYSQGGGGGRSSGSGGSSSVGVDAVSCLKAGEETILKLKNGAVREVGVLPAVDISDLMITAEQKSGPENGISYPDAEIYRYYLVTLYKAEISDIAEITYTFGVPEGWLEEHNAVPALWWYDSAGKMWTECSAKISGNDGGIVIAEAKCPGVGWIAPGGITADTPDATGDYRKDGPECGNDCSNTVAVIHPDDSEAVSSSEGTLPVHDREASPSGMAGLLIVPVAAALLRRIILRK